MRHPPHLLLCSALALCTGSRAFASASWGAAGRRLGARALHAAGVDGGIRGGAGGEKEPLQLLLVRHGESEANKARIFVSWIDSPLTARGRKEASLSGEALKAAGLCADSVFTSMLARAETTAQLMVEACGQDQVEETKRDWRLNERMVGCLVGLTMEEALERFGNDSVRLWRTSVDVRPDPIDEASENFPGNDPTYSFLPRDALPRTECLEDVRKRVAACWDEEVVPELRAGRRVAVVAHENSLRALMLHIDSGIPRDQILRFEVPRATPILYTLDPDTLAPLAPASPPFLPLTACLIGAAPAPGSDDSGAAVGKLRPSMDFEEGFRA
ncbi:histidine phosphatase superfamily [Baffinella frigidus]|nr:histidine phosphatase superfamily [Cryptophyta sp. CCMP2293]